jgi:hypothetical protein
MEKTKMSEYQKFFASALEKFGVKSPADFKTDEKKKEFFNYIEKNWKGEKTEEINPQFKNLDKIVDGHAEKISEANAFLKARSVAMWEGKNSFEFNGKIFPIIKVKGE